MTGQCRAANGTQAENALCKGTDPPPLTEVKNRERPRLDTASSGVSGSPGLEWTESTMKHNAFMPGVVACALCSMAAAALAQPKVDLGKREFETRCAVCHGLDGKGRGPYAEQLKTSLPDLTLLARGNGGVFPVSRIYETIEGAGKGHGTREMPVWGLDYTIQATEVLPDLPYNQAVYVRTRIMSLLEYLTQLQVK